MHGVNNREPNCGAHRPPAPRTAFSPPPGSLLADTPPAHSTRSPILGTAFRLPATAAPLSAAIPGSTFPACPFESRPASLRPVRSFGSATPTGSPQPLPLQRLRPVSGSPPVDADLLQRPRSPSGLLHPSRSKRLRQSNRRTRLPVAPDSPSLPAAAFFWIAGFGSSFRDRYVSG
jgi:hypothetical protein